MEDIFRDVVSHLHVKDYRFFGTIFVKVLEEAENLFGPQISKPFLRFGGFDFGSSSSCIRFEKKRLNSNWRYYFMHLSNSCLTEDWASLWFIAHECVHLLEIDPDKKVSVLEEGLGCWYQTYWVKKCPEIFPDHLKKREAYTHVPAYQRASTLVTEMLENDVSSIRRLRLIEPVISEFTAELLQNELGLKPSLAQELTQVFVLNDSKNWSDKDWEQALLEIEMSGLSIKNYARFNGLSAKTLYSKRKALLDD